MTCEFVQIPGGGTAIVCSDRKRVRCAFCEAWSTKLCDGPPREGSRKKTCDRPLCPAHAAHVAGKDIDFCPEHAGLAGEQPLLPMEDPMRGGPPRPISDVAAAAETLARARATHGAPPAPSTSLSAPTAREPGCDDGEDPAPNSPADVGFLTPEQRAAEAAQRHLPKVCSCGQPIYWAQKEDGSGSTSVDYQPSPDGTVVLIDRRGSIVAHHLAQGEEPPPGAKRRTYHWPHCEKNPRRR